jgi:hypothetical protein
MQDLIKFSHERQRFIMVDPRPPANAFEWKRFVVEEAHRRGDKSTLNANETSRKRSLASSRAVERRQVTAPRQANIANMSPHVLDEFLTPKKFHVYNKARKNNAK